MTARSTGGRLLGALAYLLVVVALWYAYVRLFSVPQFLLPDPVAVGRELVKTGASGELWPHLAYTVRNVVVGFLLGAGLGVLLGALVTRSWIIDAAMAPFLVLFQAAPKIAIAPLFVLWFGLGLTSQLALIVSLAFFPVLTGMVMGVRQIEPQYRDLGRILGLGAARQFAKIELPATLPSLFAAARISVIDSMTGAVLAEFISSERGLGYLLVYSNSTYRTPLLIVAIIVIVATGLLMYQLILLAERRLLGWHESQITPSTGG